jgi:hypothetical protein
MHIWKEKNKITTNMVKREGRLNSVFAIASWAIEFSVCDCVMGDRLLDENNLFFIYL